MARPRAGQQPFGQRRHDGQQGIDDVLGGAHLLAQGQGFIHGQLRGLIEQACGEFVGRPVCRPVGAAFIDVDQLVTQVIPFAGGPAMIVGRNIQSEGWQAAGKTQGGE